MRRRQLKNAPRFAKRQLKKLTRPVVGAARRVKSKTVKLKDTLVDPRKRTHLIQKTKIERSEKRGDWGKAIELWQELINYYGRAAPASFFVGLSRAHQGSNDYHSATEVLRKATTRYPKNKQKATNQDLRDWLAISREKAEVSLVKRIKNIHKYKKQINNYQQQRTQREDGQLKIAVFSAVSGGYDSLKPPEIIDPRFDYIFFTDTPVESIGIYDIRPLPYIDADNTRSARFVKTNPHLLLADYDVAVWVDANLLITGDIYPLIEDVLNSGKPFGAVQHPVRESPYQEMLACLEQGRAQPTATEAQMKFYKQQDYSTDQMIESNLLVYDLREQKLNEFLNEWWSQIDMFSRRDQFSINYSLDKHSTKWHKLMKRPDTARNHPALALTDHAEHSHGDDNLQKLVDLIETETIRPNEGSPYSEIKEQRLNNQQADITVVVCVHNALDDVKKCLKSIKRHNKHLQLKLIIMDDGSEDDTATYLKGFQTENNSWTTIVRHKQAQGYTKTANEGMRLSTADLTILLNSDTIVTKDWAQKMADVVLSHRGIGIVGPLSSAASHQSVPDHTSRGGQTAINQLPDGLTAEDMNQYCEQWSMSKNIPMVPLVHGFCIGITRDVINSVGYFDHGSFPRGYGEENDYCFRAANAGFKLAIATHTYVFHSKSKSFVSKERQQLMEDGMDAFVAKHGQRRIDRAVLTMKNNPVLVDLRKKFRQFY